MKRLSLKRISIERATAKAARKKTDVHRRPINALASAFTTLNLYCGIASIFAAIKGNYDHAAFFILAGIVFDSLDGSVARMTKSVSEFGKQLDSLCDVVTFGVAPAVLIYTAFLFEEKMRGTMLGRIGAVMAIIYVICGALRLARFNVYQSELRENFIGLPIPAAGGAVAALVLFTQYFELNVALWVAPFTLLLAFLMVSTVPYPKDSLKRVALAPRNAFRFLVVAAFAIALFHQMSQAALFPLTCVYLLYGIVPHLYRRIRKKGAVPSALDGQTPAPGPPDGDSSEAKKEDVL